MDNLTIPKGYSDLLGPRRTERAIQQIKDTFQTNLAFELNLVRVTAPLFVASGTGVNDDLNGVERPVRFSVGADGDRPVEIVQSLAKWKRLALADLAIPVGEGIYTDMNALRPDEVLDNIHSVYVDQWDWELAISATQRTRAFLERVVRKVYDVIRRTERYVAYEYPQIQAELPEEITFVHAQELEDRYPDLNPKEREDLVCREHGAVFVVGIGGALASGVPHDGRAPDYDDWSSVAEDGRVGLNGDILVYNRVLGRGFELSSMGVRVDPASLDRQLAIRGADDRRRLAFHQRLLTGGLPLSIGGGIGQSRLSMYLLRKAHIGEIQSGYWPDAMIAACRAGGVNLL